MTARVDLVMYWILRAGFNLWDAGVWVVRLIRRAVRL